MKDDEEKAWWIEYTRNFRRLVVPKIEEASLVVSFGNAEDNFDIQGATELGVALILGKPVLVVAPVGMTLSDGLRRAADFVIEDFDVTAPNARQRLEDAMRDVGVVPRD